MQQASETASRHRLYQELAEAVGECLVLADEPMGPHTTFGVGGPADLFVSPSTVEGVAAVARIARQNGALLHVLGCGSNVLVSDEGVRGIVMHLGESFAGISREGTVLHVQAGATNKDVALFAAEAGLAGYEFASGIPGSVGGAAIMNAGAYDGQFSDACTGVTCLDADGNVVEVDASQAAWSYRHSMMMDKGWIVLSATLQLRPDAQDAIQARMDDLAQRRASKQPLDMNSAGSTFKRPEGHFAGQLIQEAGMQGHRVGGAMVSTKHAGFVVSDGTATACDVLQVIRDVQDAVLAHAGVQLQPEVRIW